MMGTVEVAAAAEVIHRSWCYGHDECDVPFIEADLNTARATVAALAGSVTPADVSEALTVRVSAFADQEALEAEIHANVTALLARQAALYDSRIEGYADQLRIANEAVDELMIERDAALQACDSLESRLEAEGLAVEAAEAELRKTVTLDYHDDLILQAQAEINTRGIRIAELERDIARGDNFVQEQAAEIRDLRATIQKFNGASREQRVVGSMDPEFRYAEYRWVTPWREE
jgi:hypothetical protein